MSASFVLKHHPAKTVPEQLMFPRGKPLPLPWPTSHSASGNPDCVDYRLGCIYILERLVPLDFFCVILPPSGLFYILH